MQQRVEQRTAELHDLTAQNTSLKQRQELLFISIGQQVRSQPQHAFQRHSDAQQQWCSGTESRVGPAPA
jgi:hypothetical protein